jgi:hypothetical protein
MLEVEPEPSGNREEEPIQSRVLERRSGISPSEFKSRYLLPRKPVVLEDAVPDWPVLGLWDLEYFRREFDLMDIDVDGTSYNLRHLMDLIERSSIEAPAPYMRTKKIPNLFPRLMKDIQP